MVRRLRVGRQGLAVALLAALVALSACEEKNTYVPPPPPEVTVAKPVVREVTNYLEATGNTSAVNSADLIARVAGFVEAIKYNDGDFVKKGTVLFIIEQKPYELKVQQAEASEKSARASLKRSQADYQRQAELVTSGSTTQAKLDDATASRDSAQASLDQSVASLKQAELDYSYTSVAAPFDGIATRRQVSVGAYVGSGTSPTVLATVVQIDPIYVDFNVNEQDVLRVRAEIRKRGLTPRDLKQIPVEVGLQSDEGYPLKGRLDYASPTVDASTGTLAARAMLDNAKHVMLPGMFVRVRIPTELQGNALLVPDSALGNDQSGRYLFVVGKDNVVEQRSVQIGQREGTLRVISKGLKADDQVIVAGLLRAIPGQKVNPRTADAAPGAK
jgi:RND family efflux transporter MFP subunit